MALPATSEVTGGGPEDGPEDLTQPEPPQTTPEPPYTYDVSEAERPEVPTVELVHVRTAEEFERKIRGRQEWVRTALAVGAFLSLVTVLVALLVAIYGDVSPDNIEKVSAVVVTPLTGIVGTIIGFYFAERRGGG
jgi:hypothetical protein